MKWASAAGTLKDYANIETNHRVTYKGKAGIHVETVAQIRNCITRTQAQTLASQLYLLR